MIKQLQICVAHTKSLLLLENTCTTTPLFLKASIFKTKSFFSNYSFILKHHYLFSIRRILHFTSLAIVFFTFITSNAQSNLIFDNSGTFTTNSFIRSSVYPTSTLTSAYLQFALNYKARKDRAIFYGGNLGVSQTINTFGDYLGKWSFIGTWENPYIYGYAPSGPHYVTPGINYLVNYHRWGNYSAHFGLRERTSDDGIYAGEPTANPYEIKDAVISWSYEHSHDANRLIFQSIEGTDYNAPSFAHVTNEWATILSNGSFGLGTSAPGGHLHIRPHATNPSADHLIVSNSSGGTQFIIKNDGKVGIGVSSPVSILDVSGDGNFDNGYFNFKGGSTSNTNKFFNIKSASNNNVFSVDNNGRIFFSGLYYNSASSSLSSLGSRKMLVINNSTGEIEYADPLGANDEELWKVFYGQLIGGTNRYGNLFATLTDAYFGTQSNTNINLQAGNITTATIIGELPTTGPNKQGYIEFKLPIAMGGYGGTGGLTRPQAVSTSSLTLMENSSTGTNFALNCIMPNSGANILSANKNLINFYQSSFQITPTSIDAYTGNVNFFSSTNATSRVDLFGGKYVFKNSGFEVHEKIIPDNSGTVDIGNPSLNFFNDCWAVTWHNISDRRLKENIIQIPSSLATITKLNPVSYNYIFDKSKIVNGFIAQELVELIPNAVRIPTNDSEYYSVNYAAIIPVLTKGIQEQQQIIDTLKQQINLLMASNKSNENMEGIHQSEALNQLPLLFQNHPNPFNGITFIDYFLPSNANNAFIRVLDNNGRLIKAFPIKMTGYGQVELDCTTIAAGTYHYALLVNSELIDTKSMIVTGNN